VTDPADYLTMVEMALVTSPVVAEYVLVRTWANADDGYVRARLILANGDFVEVAEYFVVEADGIRTVDYRHQWMDREQSILRRRWDNTPHHPDVIGFPHHVHLDLDEVVGGEPIGVLQILTILEDEIVSST
jgi:hypothetical protein